MSLLAEQAGQFPNLPVIAYKGIVLASQIYGGHYASACRTSGARQPLLPTFSCLRPTRPSLYLGEAINVDTRWRDTDWFTCIFAPVYEVEELFIARVLRDAGGGRIRHGEADTVGRVGEEMGVFDKEISWGISHTVREATLQGSIM